MLVNIRGTSGSGKTTLIRLLMQDSELVKNVFISGRKRPIYSIRKLWTGEEFAIMGHYEAVCGGCDTIKSLDEVYTYVKEAFEAAPVVFAEGLLLGKDVKRILTVKSVILYLNTSLEDCYAGVRQRRIDKGDLEKAEIKPKALENDHKGILSAVNRLRDKMEVVNITRKDGFELMLNIIKGDHCNDD